MYLALTPPVVSTSGANVIDCGNPLSLIDLTVGPTVAINVSSPGKPQ